MSSSKQKTGGSATPGPGLKAGVSSGVAARKVSIPGNYKTSPNSASRGKQGNGK